MPSLTDCLAKSPLPEAHQKYIVERSRFHQEKGLSESDADAQAIKDLQAETRASLRDVYRQLGVKGYELPKMKVASGEQPVQPKGHTPVTLSGLSEQERQQRIEQRKAKTTLSDRDRATNEVMDMVKRYNELPGGHLGKMKEEGRSLLNSIRVKASELGMTFDERAGKMRNAEGTIIRKNFSEVGDKAIKDNGKTLMERDSHTQDVFKQLLDEGIFPNGTRLDGKTMSEAEREGTIDDIVNGIPSERAHNYLDQLEGMIGKNRYEIGDNKTGKTAVPLDTLLNVSKSVTTEPMSEDALQKWLSGESELPNDDHLLHNLEHILEDYEPEQDQAGREESPATEVQQPEPNTEKGSTGAALPNEPPTASAGSPEESAAGAGPTKSAAEPVSGGAEPPKEGAPVEKGSGKVTGVKRAITDATRMQRDLPPVDVPKLGTASERLQKGKELVDSGKINPRDMVSRILTGNDSYHNADEVNAMQYYAHQLSKQEDRLREQKNNHAENSPEHIDAVQQLNQLRDEMEDQTRAARIAGKGWSDVGNSMKTEADENFNPTNEKVAIEGLYGGKVPGKVKERIDLAFKQIEEGKAELQKERERIAAQQMKKDQIREEKQNKRKQTKEDIRKERDDLRNELKRIKDEEEKKGYSKMGGGSIPNAAIPVLGKLALNYFKEGVVTVESIADKVYHDVKDLFEGIDKAAVRRMIASYPDLKQAAHDKELGRLDRKEKDLNKQLETGNYRKWPEKPNVVYKKTTAMLQAEAKVIRAEHVLKLEKIKATEAQRSKEQKVFDWMLRWERRLILASTGVFVKLSSAATVGSALYRIPKEAVGFIASQAFTKLADKAPVEGHFNARAFGKFYTEFLNPKKLITNAAQIIKTGSSDLAKQHEGAAHRHYPVFDLFTGDLHTIIKDPPKRAAYEAALIKYFAHAERNGLDINDPLVQTTLQHKAYKVAKYEIFQEESKLGKWFNNKLEEWNQKGNSGRAFLAHFLIPIQSVPLNIARRLELSTTGLAKGMWNTVKAYHKGIENLSEDQAELIMRQLKFGSLGNALIGVGIFMYANHFGGLYNKDLKKKDQDMETDEMNIGGLNIPKPVQHALPLELIQLGATFGRIYSKYNDEGSEGYASFAQALWGTGGAMVEQIPIINEPVHFAESFTDPYMRKKFFTDVKRRVGADKAEMGLEKVGVIPPSDE